MRGIWFKGCWILGVDFRLGVKKGELYSLEGRENRIGTGLAMNWE